MYYYNLPFTIRFLDHNRKWSEGHCKTLKSVMQWINMDKRYHAMVRLTVTYRGQVIYG